MYLFLLGVLAIFGLVWWSCSKEVVINFIDRFFPPMKMLDTEQALLKRNVNYETHLITTQDGYILKIFRIYETLPAPGHVVLMQHGLLSDSTDWVAFDGALGYLLRDLGWDVWLGNHRGNVYCRAHTEFSANSRQFWDFSFHELGCKDLPAVIDYILGITGKAKLVYIGHSQGCSEFFAMNSFYPGMNDKILAMFALGPVAGLRDAATRFPIPYKLAVIDQLHPSRSFFKAMGFFRIGFFWEYPKSLDTLIHLLLAVVVYPLFNRTLAVKAMAANTNFPHPDVIENSLEFFLLCRLRNGCSLLQLNHFSQSLTGEHYFHCLDRGRRENLRVYGQICPPAYDISRITCHVSLLWGKLDSLTCPRDVYKLFRRLKNRSLFALNDYKHGDFVCSSMRNDIIIKHIIDTIKLLSNDGKLNQHIHRKKNDV